MARPNSSARTSGPRQLTSTMRSLSSSGCVEERPDERVRGVVDDEADLEPGGGGAHLRQQIGRAEVDGGDAHVDAVGGAQLGGERRRAARAAAPASRRSSPRAASCARELGAEPRRGAGDERAACRSARRRRSSRRHLAQLARERVLAQRQARDDEPRHQQPRQVGRERSSPGAASRARRAAPRTG